MMVLTTFGPAPGAGRMRRAERFAQHAPHGCGSALKASGGVPPEATGGASPFLGGNALRNGHRHRVAAACKAIRHPLRPRADRLDATVGRAASCSLGALGIRFAVAVPSAACLSAAARLDIFRGKRVQSAGATCETAWMSPALVRAVMDLGPCLRFGLVDNAHVLRTSCCDASKFRLCRRTAGIWRR